MSFQKPVPGSPSLEYLDNCEVILRMVAHYSPWYMAGSGQADLLNPEVFRLAWARGIAYLNKINTIKNP